MQNNDNNNTNNNDQLGVIPDFQVPSGSGIDQNNEFNFNFNDSDGEDVPDNLLSNFDDIVLDSTEMPDPPPTPEVLSPQVSHSTRLSSSESVSATIDKVVDEYRVNYLNDGLVPEHTAEALADADLTPAKGQRTDFRRSCDFARIDQKSTLLDYSYEFVGDGVNAPKVSASFSYLEQILQTCYVKIASP